MGQVVWYIATFSHILKAFFQAVFHWFSTPSLPNLFTQTRFFLLEELDDTNLKGKSLSTWFRSPPCQYQIKTT